MMMIGFSADLTYRRSTEFVIQVLVVKIVLSVSNFILFFQTQMVTYSRSFILETHFEKKKGNLKNNFHNLFHNDFFEIKKEKKIKIRKKVVFVLATFLFPSCLTCMFEV